MKRSRMVAFAAVLLGTGSVGLGAVGAGASGSPRAAAAAATRSTEALQVKVTSLHCGHLTFKVFRPPAGFTVATSTTSSRTFAGPDGTFWEPTTRRLHFGVPACPTAQQLRSTERMNSSVESKGFAWSGYTIKPQPGYDSMAGADLVWTIPQSSPPNCNYNDSAAVWPGLGEGYDTGHLLAQAGVTTNDYCNFWGDVEDTPTPWWELTAAGAPSQGDVTNQNEALPCCFSPAIGDDVAVAVQHTGPGDAEMSFTDDTTGATDDFQVSWDSTYTLAGETADYVVERPTVDGSLPTLANFGTMQLGGGYQPGTRASIGQSFVGIGGTTSASRTFIEMYDCTPGQDNYLTQMDQTEALGSDSYWNEKFLDYGVGETCGG